MSTTTSTPTAPPTTLAPQRTPLTDDEKRLLDDYLDPNLALSDLSAIHCVTLSELEELLERDETRTHLARLQRLSSARAEHIKATSQDKAAAALADLLTHEYTHQPPSPETRRRAATAILATNAHPTQAHKAPSPLAGEGDRRAQAADRVRGPIQTRVQRTRSATTTESGSDRSKRRPPQRVTRKHEPELERAVHKAPRPPRSPPPKTKKGEGECLPP